MYTYVCVYLYTHTHMYPERRITSSAAWTPRVRSSGDCKALAICMIRSRIFAGDKLLTLPPPGPAVCVHRCVGGGGDREGEVEREM